MASLLYEEGGFFYGKKIKPKNRRTGKCKTAKPILQRCHLVEPRPHQVRFGCVRALTGTPKGQSLGQSALDADGFRQKDRS